MAIRSDTFPGAVDIESTTPLGASATFTSKTLDVTQFSTIVTYVDSDQDGTLKMQFSSDGTNWDRTKQVPVDQTIGSGSVHTLEVVAQYFRIVYVNGSVAQTHFRLQSICHRNKSGFLTSSPDEIISRINDAQLVRLANDPFIDASRGLYADKSVVHKFGANPDVGTGGFEAIWFNGGTYPWPDGSPQAETIRVKAGGNAADIDTTGAGARTIIVEGLSATYEPQSSTIALAGADASDATSELYSRVHRAYVATCGTYGSANTGDIVIENTTSNDVLANIGAGLGQTQLSQYTVRAGYKAYLLRITMEVEGSKPAEIRMMQRQNADDTSAPVSPVRIVHDALALDGTDTVDFRAMPEFPEKTDLWFEAQASSGGGATAVDVAYDLLLVKDTTLITPQ